METPETRKRGSTVPIITVASSKGGAGKTTIARVLLGRAAQSGLKAAALDADLNHSLADWIASISKCPVTVRAEVDETRIVPTVSELQKGHDFLVIDTAGAAAQATIFAIGCADLVLVPLKLSSSDVLEATKTMNLVKSAAAMMGRQIPARVVLTGYKPRTMVAAHVEKEIANAKLPELRARLHDLVAFEEMTFSGMVPVAGLAGLQAEALYEETLALTAQPKSRRKLAS
jgi:chromosome partitioning protein